MTASIEARLLKMQDDDVQKIGTLGLFDAADFERLFTADRGWLKRTFTRLRSTVYSGFSHSSDL